jgi:hypothetical protein
MTDESKKTLAKVRMLLSRTEAKGFTPAEAAEAAAKAQQLLFKANLELSDVELLEDRHADPLADYGQEDVELLARGKFNVNWHRILLSGIARNNFCRIVVTTARRRFKGERVAEKKCAPEKCAVIGRPHNVEFVRWLYTHVAVQIREMSLVAMREHCFETLPARQGAWARTFCFAAVTTVLQRLAEQRKQDEQATASSTALVHVTDAHLKAAVTKFFPRLSKGSAYSLGSNGTAARHGAEAGRRVSINRPIAPGRPARALNG